MCTPHVAGSSVAFWNGTAFGPGLLFPVIALPSQLNSRTTCDCLSLDGPQSPLHVPLSGWPNCADAGIARKSASTTARTNRITTSLTGNCIPTGNDLPYQDRILDSF